MDAYKDKDGNPMWKSSNGWIAVADMESSHIRSALINPLGSRTTGQAKKYIEMMNNELRKRGELAEDYDFRVSAPRDWTKYDRVTIIVRCTNAECKHYFGEGLGSGFEATNNATAHKWASTHVEHTGHKVVVDAVYSREFHP